MRNITTYIGIVLAFLVVSYLFTAVRTDLTVRDINNRANDPTSEPIISEAEARKEFMIGCDTDEIYLQGAYCGCVYERIVKAYGVNKFLSDTLQYGDGITTIYEKEINYCLDVVYESKPI